MTDEPAGAAAEPQGDGALIDTTRPHQARIYDYWLGGTDNYAVDREAAERALAAYPGLRRGVRAQRAFLANVVEYLAGTAGVRQFLDIGTGIPTAGNTQVVVAPTSAGAAAGAALLAHWGEQREPPRLDPARAWSLPALEAYRRRWEQAL